MKPSTAESAVPESSAGDKPPAVPAEVELTRHPSVRRILSGPLPLEVFRFGLPLAIGMGLQTTFNLVDAYIIARLGGVSASAALAAIGSCDNMTAAGAILSYGLSIATGTIVSRKHGEGDDAGMRRVAWQSLLLVGSLSVLFGVFGLFGAETLMRDVMQAKGQAAEVGIPYLRISLAGSGSIFLLLHLITLQRALGSSKLPILLLVLSNALNLFWAVLLVYGPGEAPPVFAWGPPLAEWLGLPRLELTGAAWATVGARAITLIPAFLIVYYRHSLFRRDVRLGPDRAILRRIWEIGWPTSSQLVVRIAAIVLVVAFAQHGFTTAEDQSVATMLGIVLRWETLVLFVGLGWGSASQTFMGQNLGAGNVERARLSGWYATLCNLVMMGGFAVVCQLWGAEMIQFFSPEPRVIELGVEYLRWIGPSYLALGAGIVLGSAIQGAGATRQTFFLDLAVIFGVQLPLCWWAANFSASPARLWQVVALTNCAFAVIYLLAYRRGAFLRTKIG